MFGGVSLSVKFVLLGGCHDNLSMLQLFCDYLNISLYGDR